ncbi:GMP/IMP nucleotidase [Pseudoalteromonas fenneropenaei]|uniref:GMP/IMP nucleotidase n=1 Tax=Pseudoalteromonas fenneropenaei TaxID=1737459 RepID=A0ABV7CL21_9GAMM
MLNWSEIDTVLLDMDGTLLDLHYDNHFWLEVIPREYANKHQLTFDKAKAIIEYKYASVMGQLSWYCLDYWQRELDLPILELKREIQHLISLREDTIPFLQFLRAQHKQVILLTNAHPGSLSLKIERTQFDHYFDRLISTHEYGYSKEQQALWHAVQKDLGFDNSRTLFVDDSLSVLRSAKQFGIKHLLAIANPDSRKPHNEISEFFAITSYHQVIAT